MLQSILAVSVVDVVLEVDVVAVFLSIVFSFLPGHGLFSWLTMSPS